MASAKHKLRARGGLLKNPACPHTIFQAVPVFKYERGYLIGNYFETHDPQIQSRTEWFEYNRSIRAKIVR